MHGEGKKYLTKGVDCRHRSILLFFTSRSRLGLFCLLLVSNCLNVNIVDKINLKNTDMLILLEDDDITDDSRLDEDTDNTPLPSKLDC